MPIVVTAGCPFERLKGLWLFAQDPLEGVSKAFARGNADVAMIAVAPFRTVQGTAGVIGAEFIKEVERGGFRLGCGCFFRGKSEFIAGFL